MNLNDLRTDRGRLVREMRGINDLASKEKRALTSEEDAKWNALDTAQESLKNTIEREERQAKLDVEMNQPVNPPGPAIFSAPPGASTAKTRESMFGKRSLPEYDAAFRSFLANGLSRLPESEYRALQMDVDLAGGYAVVSEQFINQLIQGVDNEVFVRQYATKFAVPTAASLGVPVLDTDAADAEWTSELLTGTLDVTMALGKRSLHPHALVKAIKVSNDLIRQSAISIDTLVKSRFAYKIGIAQENKFLNGTGSGEPLGVMIASTSGISTGRDVSTDNTSTAVTADGLINAKYTLKGQYHKNARWIFHRDCLKMIRKLKTTTSGDYVWRAGLAADKADTILDMPYHISEYMPSTFTTLLYVGILGDFSYFWIADAMDMSIQVVDQLYATTNQTGYFARLKCDGMPVLEEAFVRVKLG